MSNKVGFFGGLAIGSFDGDDSFPTIDLSDGNGAAVSHAGHARIRFNLSTQQVEQSINTGAWVAFATSSSSGSALAKYIIQTADASVPNAQVLSTLGTGIVKNTSATGVLSIAIANTDYPAVSAQYVVATGTAAPPNAQNLGALTNGILKQTVSGGIATISIAVPGIDYAARIPQPGEFWVYCIDYDGRTLVGNDTTAAPGISGPPSRIVTVTGTDHVVGSTRTWTFANANFVATDVKGQLVIGGTATNTGKSWQILSVTNSTTVVTVTTTVNPDFSPQDAPTTETFTTATTLKIIGGAVATMAAALALAVQTPFKTYERAGQLLPRNGNGATMVTLVRPRSGRTVYKDMDGVSDCSWVKWIENCYNWSNFIHRPTADFTNSTFDKIQCGFRIIPGLNTNGYNPITGRTVTVTNTDNVVAATKTWTFANGAFTVLDTDRDLVLSGVTNTGTFRITQFINSTTVVTSGTPVNETFNSGSPILNVNGSTRSFAVQLAGGGSAALPANGTAVIDGGLISTSPFLTGITGKRIRFASNTTTTALQNFCTSVYSNDASNMVPSFALPAAYSASDIFFIEETELHIGLIRVALGVTARINFVLGYTLQSPGPVIIFNTTSAAFFCGLDAPDDLGGNHTVFNTVGRTFLVHRYIDESIASINIGCAGLGRLEPANCKSGFSLAAWYDASATFRTWVNMEQINIGLGCVFASGILLIGGSTSADIYTTGDAVDQGSGELADLTSGIGNDTSDGLTPTGAFGSGFGSFIYKRTRFPGSTAAGGMQVGGIWIVGRASVRIHGIDFSNMNPCITMRGQGGHIYIDDVVSTLGGNTCLVDLAGAYQASVIVGTFPSAGIGGRSSDPSLACNVISMATNTADNGTRGVGPKVAVSDLAFTNFTDEHDNNVQGTGGIVL